MAIRNTVGASLSVLLLVRLQVEVDEEPEVAGQKPATKQGRCLGARTVAHVGKDSVIIRCRKVTIRCTELSGDPSFQWKTPTAEVHKEEVDHELGDLHHCQVLFPLRRG